MVARSSPEAATILTMAVSVELAEDSIAVMAMQQVVASQQAKSLVPVLKVSK